ncbi:MAG: valine--tRNA ligase [Candidatus Liptonbacteria bacterium]|nr:valine--tRNA ligase [Candidatus Liptonbacteria bacterium]
MDSNYDFQKSEPEIYEAWEKSGYFTPEKCVENGIAEKDAEVFSIVLPPPNVTGVLHMGHAAMLAIEDILVRYARMNGKRTLWIPGTDHAAIATQSKVESQIQKKEGKNRRDLGREEFLRRVDDFAKESHDTIVRQIKKMGASIDWGREAFTLDEKRNLAVKTAFLKMYEGGLIYRGDRVINWDPKGQTTVSDDEVTHEERKAKLYTFKYSKDFPIAISTTRPETKFGDTAVAVHPDDERYKQYVGKVYDVEFCGVPLNIKIIADHAVEKDFGTGALGVTPAHSATDYDIAMRHGLPLKQVINEYARMTVGGQGVKDKKTTEAREAVVAWLKEAGLMEKEEETVQNISVAERTGGIIEPLPKLQWFVDVNKKFKLENSRIKDIPPGAETTLKEIMRKTVESGQIKIVPEKFEKIYFNWIDNLRDWCISRQIWYGHRIPVWYKDGEISVGMEAPKDDGPASAKASEGKWIQDEDTLDTWFSSGLWTFSTLGYPENTDDLKTYHPTSVLETGYDILFFWVARMILMTGFLLGDIPFKTVYLHGLVRDEKGRKMSKSLGNAIDPLTMAEKYGADATRLSLIIGAAPGNDLKLSEDKVRGYRNFSTKIWNAARFVLTNKPQMGAEKLSTEEEKYLAEFEAVKKEITEHIEKFELHLAGEKAYHYFWHTFADVIIEAEKEKLKNGSTEERTAAYVTLEKILLGSLVLLHPFIPYVTEAVYGKFRPGKLLIVEPWQE